MSEETTMTEQDQKDILSMDEATTYFLINECGMFLFRMNHDMADGRIPEEAHEGITKDMVNIREVQKFAADHLDRFGVDPESVEDKTEGEYWKWYTFWDEWKKNLTDDEWKVVATGEYKEYLPTTSWKDETSTEE
jgi:hypothetical protein